MDKKKIGAVVGVLGVTGAFAAAQFLDIDASKANYMTKDLAEKYQSNVTEDSKDKAASVDERVFDSATKVEYFVAKPIEIAAAKDAEPEKEAAPEEKVPEKAEIPPVQPKQEVQVEVSKKEEAPAPVEEQPTEFDGIVNVDLLYIRKSANADSETLGYYLRNDVVRGTLYKGWVEIKTEKGATGYVSVDYIRDASTEEVNEQEQANKWIAEEEARAKAETAAAEEAERKAEEEAKAAEAAKKAEEEAAAKAAEEAARKAEEEAAAKAAEEEAKAKAVSGYVQSLVGANVRSGASLDDSILGVLPVNSSIEGTREGEWIKLEYNGSVGYVKASLVGDEKVVIETPEEPAQPETPSTPAPDPEPAYEMYSGYVKTAAYLRKGPGTNYDSITVLSVNTPIEGKLVNGWVEFERGGQTVYISKVVLSDEPVATPDPAPDPQPEAPSSDQSVAARVVELAKSKIGCRYVWGAEGPSSFDCSGLVTWAYRNGAGISLVHQSRSQAQAGYAVSMDNLQPGDLLFYATSGGSYISHVAMYIGNGMMVHASSPSTGVRTDSVYSSWYMKRLVTVRRILN